MNREQLLTIAREHGFGNIHFQFNVSKNGGREFEVGYVKINNSMELFCKRQPNTSDDQFYLCNEFRKLKVD